MLCLIFGCCGVFVHWESIPHAGLLCPDCTQGEVFGLMAGSLTGHGLLMSKGGLPLSERIWSGWIGGRQREWEEKREGREAKVGI